MATRTQRGSRLRSGIQLRDRSGGAASRGGSTPGAANGGRRSRTSLQAAGAAPAKPRGRQSRTSRAAEGRDEGGGRGGRYPPRRGRPAKKATKGRGRGGGGSRDLSPGSWEEDDDDDDDDEDDDDEDEDQDEERRRRAAGRNQRYEKRRSRVEEEEEEDDDDDDDEDEEEEEDGEEDDDEEEEERIHGGRRTKQSGTGGGGGGKGRKRSAGDDGDGGGDAGAHEAVAWKCPICTVDNALESERCVVCAHRRPAAALPRGSRKRQRQEQQPDEAQGVDGSDGRSSDDEQDTFDQDGGGGGGRRGGESTRQRRGVPRVNYAEDDDGGAPGRGTKATAGKQGRRGGGAGKASGRGGGGKGRNAPLALSGELRLEAKWEEALPDEVRAFRRLVRSAVKGFYREDYALHFRDAVDLESYPQYVEVVAEPMDLAKIMFKLRQGEYDSREVGGAVRCGARCGAGRAIVLERARSRGCWLLAATRACLLTVKVRTGGASFVLLFFELH